MSKIELVIDAENKPANLPSPEVIIQQCRRARAANSNIRGIPLVEESHDSVIHAWVKFGWIVTMSEAQTQHFVAQVLNDKAGVAVRSPYVYVAFQSDGIGYIVMEYIDGSTCDDSDAKLVATAVQSLITVQGPTAEPGPVGGGPIVHRFFIDWESSVTYNSVEVLEKHINGASVPLRLALPAYTFAGFRMITLNTDSSLHGQDGTCQLPVRG